MTRWFIVSVVATLLAFAGTYYVYHLHFDALPEQIATHWGIDGQADAWTNKDSAWAHFYIAPMVMVGLLGLTLVLPWLSPKQFAIDGFQGVYGYLMMLVTLLMGFIHGLLLYATNHPESDTGKWLVCGILAFLALFGNHLGQLRKNFWIGIRTPWTLASDQVWIQTHRLAGWIFFFGGLGGAFAILLGVPVWVCFPILLGIALVPVIYSLVYYKQLEKLGKL